VGVPGSIQPAAPLQQDPSKRLGYFAHSSHYLKLYEMLKGVHNSTGGSAALDNQVSTNCMTKASVCGIQFLLVFNLLILLLFCTCSQKELSFLRHCLGCLSSILEFSLANTVGKHTEEVLQYLKTVFNLVRNATGQYRTSITH
jgi:hypothetical protein